LTEKQTNSGAGVAAVRERIRQSFLAIHNDQRDREQRQADEELMAAIQSEEKKVEEESVELVKTAKLSTAEKADLCIKAALRAPHIVKNMPRRTNIHGVYVIEEVKEDWQTLCDEALRSLK
jgi:hypothetical protein